MEPKTTPFRLDLQPLASSDTLNSFGIDLPTSVFEHNRNPTITIATISRASLMISAVQSSSSTFPCDLLRWVERCWPIILQLRRSLTTRVCRTCMTALRRGEGSVLSRNGFFQDQLIQPRSEIAFRSCWFSFFDFPKAGSTDRWPCHGIPKARDSRSLRLHPSGVWLLMLTSPGFAIPQPVLAWSRLLPVCIFAWLFELPFQKLDRFNFLNYLGGLIIRGRSSSNRMKDLSPSIFMNHITSR